MAPPKPSAFTHSSTSPASDRVLKPLLSFTSPFPLPTHKASVSTVIAMSSLWGEQGGGTQRTGRAVRVRILKK